MPRLLLVEDDAKLARMLTQGLEEEGYSVEVAADGQTGLKRISAGAFDVCVLDILLPELDGFTVIERARKARVRTPILILTARDGVPDRVRGLNLGADDYLVKPFAFAELLARLQALLRRGTAPRGHLQCGTLRVDPDAHRAWRGETELELSHRQFLLLEYLVRHQGQVVTRAMILKEIWGYDFNTGTNIVDVHIANLRQRVDAGPGPSLIQTVRGVGYRISQPDAVDVAAGPVEEADPEPGPPADPEARPDSKIESADGD